MAEQSLQTEAGMYFFTYQDEMYTIRGYMQANPNLNKMVLSAYEHWDKVVIDKKNAHLYADFFSVLLPRMDKLINQPDVSSDILIDDTLYDLIQSIVSVHDHIDDPDFILLKEQFVNTVETVRGANFQQVRSWVNSEF